jgi:hypothetical protein
MRREDRLVFKRRKFSPYKENVAFLPYLSLSTYKSLLNDDISGCDLRVEITYSR